MANTNGMCVDLCSYPTALSTINFNGTISCSDTCAYPLAPIFSD